MYVLILYLEILFILIKNDPNIKGIEIFEYCYLYTAYAYDTTFFLKDENSIVHPSEKLKLFSDFSGLIGVLKGVQVAICGMKCIDYNIISNIQGVLNLWRMRNLTLEGRIVVFKTLGISKIVFLALLTKIPH